MAEDISPKGKVVVLHFYDGTDVQYVGSGAGHRLPVDVEAIVLPSGAATAVNQATIITAIQSLQNLVGALDSVGIDEIDVNVEASVLPSGAATDTVVQAIRDRIGALTSPAAGSTNKLLADMLTALQLIDDLRGALDSVDTDELVVNVDESVLPSGAATETTLDAIKTAAEIIDGFANANNTLLGYNDRYSERTSNLNASAGTNVLSATAVPSGEVWIIQSAGAFNINTNPTTINVSVFDGAVDGTIASQASPGINVRVLGTGAFLMKEGDYVRAIFEGCVAGDDIYLDVWGYKMKV